MKYAIFLFFMLFSLCVDRDEEDFKKSCPYDLKYGGHFLRIPITITPHKLTYKVGDTLLINTIFSDSIYDLGTQQTFKIANFPFKPLSLLYRFTSDTTYDSGYRVNELFIDSVYNHVYNYSSSYADGFQGHTIYKDNQYRFESQLIFKEPGRYVLLFSDLYQSFAATGNGDLNAEADAITFEGKCPTLDYYLCSIIESGDDNLELFKDELVYLDNNVYRGGLVSIAGSTGPLKSGGIIIELSGFFGFMVEE